MVISNTYTIFLVNIIIGFVIMFVFPKIIDKIIRFRKSHNIQTFKFGEKYWLFILEYKILIWIGILWILFSFFFILEYIEIKAS